MANIINSQENEENKKSEVSPLSQPTVGNSTTPSSGSATASPSPTSTSSAPPTDRPQGSGRFTNIQKYLGANKGAGSRLADGIEKKSDEYTSSVREGIASAQNVQQGAQNELNRIGKADGFAEQIGTDAVGLAGSHLNDVTQLRTGVNDANRLQGQGIQTSNNLQQGLNPLNQLGQNLGTEGGRFQALQDVFGGAYNAGYGTGQRRLDQVFLQSQAGDRVQDLQNSIGQTVEQGNSSLDTLSNVLGNDISNIASGARSAQGNILGAIGTFDGGGSGALGNLHSGLEDSVDRRTDELTDELGNLRAQFGSGNISRDLANQLGLNGDYTIGDLDLNSVANNRISLGDVSFADAITSDQSATLDALAQLAGNESSFYDLGDADSSDFNFDNDGFLQDIIDNHATYDDRFFQKDYNDIVDDKFHIDQGYYSDRVPDRGSIEEYINNISTSRTADPAFSHRGIFDLDPNQDRGALSSYVDQANAGAARGEILAGQEDAFLQQLLNIYDQDRARKLNIFGGPESDSDLELGGNFNVT